MRAVQKTDRKASHPPASTFNSLYSTLSSRRLAQLSRAIGSHGIIPCCNPLGPKAWKADTSSAGVVGPGNLIKESAKGPEGRNIKIRNANSNHDAITGTNSAAKHQYIGYRDLGFYPFRVEQSLLPSIPGRRSALPWAITFGPLGAKE